MNAKEYGTIEKKIQDLQEQIRRVNASGVSVKKRRDALFQEIVRLRKKQRGE